MNAPRARVVIDVLQTARHCNDGPRTNRGD
jgi:hypothetical protein